MKLLTSYLLYVGAFLSITACDSGYRAVLPVGETKVEPPKVGPAKDEIIKLNGGSATRIVLPNGLKVILVSAPTSKNATASVAVQAGGANDPRDKQGLAHYLEHMLFQGTAEFPQRGEYFQYLQSNGGGANAHTGANLTNYFFQIRAELFENAVHRLSRFFVNPNFNPMFSEDEKEVVHKEFNLRFENAKAFRPADAFRQNSDWSKTFIVGNAETLKSLTAEDTRKFFEEHYYAEAMQVILASPQSLEELKALATKYFGDIKSNAKRPVNTYSEFSNFNFENLPARVNSIPANGDKFLNLTIPVAAAKDESDKMLFTLGQIIGDESESSLLNFLQKKGLVRIGSNTILAYTSNSALNINVDLTEAGAKAVDRVINYIYGYLGFLKKEGMPAYLNDEITNLYSSHYRAIEYYELDAEKISQLNDKYMYLVDKPDWRELFTGEVEKDPTKEEFDDYLSRLLFAKVLIEYSHPENKSADVVNEPYTNMDSSGVFIVKEGEKRALVDSIYGYTYGIDEVDTSLFKPEGIFKMKTPNPYVPKTFALLTPEDAPQFEEITEEWGRAYYSPMNTEGLAQAYLSMDIFSDGFNFQDKKDVAMLFLFRELLQIQFASGVSELTNFGFKLKPDPRNPEMVSIDFEKGNLTIFFSGWSDTYAKAFSDIIGLTKMNVTPEEFVEVKEFFINKSKVKSNSDSGSFFQRTLFSMVSSGILSYADLFATLESLDHSTFQNFINRFSSGLYLQMVLTGNVNKELIGNIIEPIKRQWKPKWAASSNWDGLLNRQSLVAPPHLSAPLPLFEQQVVGPEKESAVYGGFWTFKYQPTTKEKLTTAILGQWLNTDFFDVLRTEKKFAYSLQTSGWDFMDSVGMMFHLVSSELAPDQIETEVDQFFENWIVEYLPTKTQEMLDNAVVAILQDQILPQSPQRRHGFYYGILNAGNRSVEEYMEKIGQAKTITLDDVVKMGQQHLITEQKKGAFVKVSKKPATD